MSVDTKTVVIGGLLVSATLVLTMLGPTAEKNNTLHDMTHNQKIKAMQVAPEALKTKLITVATEERSSGGKVRTSYVVWKFFETQDWVLLNGADAQNVCAPVFKAFMEANAPKAAFTLDQMEALTVAYRGQDVELWAHVPRFNGKPAGLAKCPGFGFDAERGLVTLGARPVAVMALEQPGLVQ